MPFAQSSLPFPEPAPLPELNPQQKIAVQHTYGPMLVRAGAGTGKTTVLTRRIARLVNEGIAKPGEVLAITFTNAAAEEMQDKLSSPHLLGAAARQVQACTFHSYCHNVLRRHATTFRLLSAEDLWVYFRRRIEHLELDYFAKASDPGTFLRTLTGFFDRCSDELVSPEEFAAYVDGLEDESADTLPRIHKSQRKEEVMPEQVVARLREIARVYRKSSQMLEADQIGSFGSLIVGTARLFAQKGPALAVERTKARFILVDEFQDTNHSQLEILRHLAGDEQNIFVVGDPDQAIYRFRGASTGAFEDFTRTYPTTQSVTLAENQRSVQNVLDCAWQIIAKNPDTSAIDSEFARAPLRSGRAKREASSVPDPVELVHHTGALHEAHEVANWIAERVRATGDAYREFAVLYRSHSAAAQIIRELDAKGIPVNVTGTNLLCTDTGRDLLAILRCLVTLDDDLSLFRMAMMGRFGLNRVAVRDALRSAKKSAARVAAVLGDMESGRAFLNEFRGLRAQVAWEATTAARAIEKAIAVFGVADTLEGKYLLRAAQQWMEKPCVGAAPGADRLPDFLSYLDLWAAGGGTLRAEERDVLGARLRVVETPNAVQLMTVHAAKGLEFKHTLLVRVASGSFPIRYQEPLFEFPQALRRSAHATVSDKQLHEQEERRLFYVALTRAKNHLVVLGKEPTGKDPIPSAYMRELAKAAVLTHKVRVRPAAAYVARSLAAGASEAWHELPGDRGQSELRLSATQIEMYSTCPKKFYFAREWNLPSEPGLALGFGSAIHNALCALFKDSDKGVVLSEVELLALFEADFRAYEKSADDLHQFELYLAQGRKYLKEFYRHQVQEAKQLPAIRALEYGFRTLIDDVAVDGRIDRVDVSGNGLVVLDYKTGSAKSQEQADKSLQLSLYAIAAEREWGQPVTAVGFYNLETNSPVLSLRTSSQLDKARETVREVAEGIRAGEYEPKPNGFCRMCDYQQLCPATAEILPTLKLARVAP